MKNIWVKDGREMEANDDPDGNKALEACGWKIKSPFYHNIETDEDLDPPVKELFSDDSE